MTFPTVEQTNDWNEQEHGGCSFCTVCGWDINDYDNMTPEYREWFLDIRRGEDGKAILPDRPRPFPRYLYDDYPQPE